MMRVGSFAVRIAAMLVVVGAGPIGALQEAGCGGRGRTPASVGTSATGRVLGQVRDARNDRPVAAASVSVPGRPETVQSNSRGYFVLSGLPVGEHELSVRHLGYAPLVQQVAVARGLTTEAMIGLSPDPVELASLVAVATRSRRLEITGFYERREWGELTGGGEFFAAEDIERRNPTRISHMIADVPGVRLGNCGVQAHGCLCTAQGHRRGSRAKVASCTSTLTGPWSSEGVTSVMPPKRCHFRSCE